MQSILSMLITGLMTIGNPLYYKAVPEAFAKNEPIKSEAVSHTAIEEKTRETGDMGLTGATSEVLTAIDVYADKYNVSPSLMREIINLESGFDQNAEGDNHESCGLVQINIPSHPSITCEKAKDIEFSIEFLAKNLSEGKCRLWSTCFQAKENIKL